MAESSSPVGEPRSLRERKRRSTMHRIQETAVGLFERHGFDQVTVEQVAEHAEVSPSTVYRYFGTKEGLVVTDEHDATVVAVGSALLATHDLYTAVELALQSIAQEHFVEDADLTMRRTRLWMEEPSVRAASLIAVHDFADQLAAVLASSPGCPWNQEECRIVTASVTWSLIAALENWWRAGAREPMIDHLIHAIRLLRTAPSAPGGSESPAAPGRLDAPPGPSRGDLADVT